MLIPKQVPLDVLSTIPDEKAWHSQDWNDDTVTAHQHFFKKSLTEAVSMFAEYSLLYQEDVMFMPFIPCCYYLQAYSNYILSERATGDSDGAICYITLIKVLNGVAENFPAELCEVIGKALNHIARSQGLFDAKIEIYGSFEDRISDINWRF
jgi:hypothetical protein